MARSLVEAGSLAAAEVVHRKFHTLPASATIADVRAWFAASERRRMALLTDEAGCYAGSLTRADLEHEADPGRPAAELARLGPTIGPQTPASEGYAVATKTDALRVPVVDDDGRLVGVLSVTGDLSSFCGT